MFTFLDPRTTIDRVIVSTTSEEDLEAELVSGESLIHLDLLDVYIVEGVNPANVEDRVEDFELTEGVEWAIADAECEPCTFVPNEGVANLWWMQQGHNAGYATSGSNPFGWGVRRSATATTPVAVIDSGVAGVHNDPLPSHEDLGSRVAGVAVYTGIVVEETAANDIAYDNLGHGTGVASMVAATGNNTVGTIGAGWWGTPIVPVKYYHQGQGGFASFFLQALEWALAEDIKVVVFAWYPTDVAPLYAKINTALENTDSVLFWALNNTGEPYDNTAADLPNIVWAGATDSSNEPAEYSPAVVEMDCRAAVGDDRVGDIDPANSSKVCLPFGTNTYEQNTGNSLAAPMMAGLVATLFDALPSSLTDEERRDLAVDILLRTCDKIADDDGNWGRMNTRNAYGIPPATVSVVTGSGSPTVADFWREEGTVTTISSDQNIPGTLRVIVDTVHPVPYADQETVGDLHFRFRVGGLSTTATVKLKHQNSSFVTVGTIPVTTTPVLSELYIYSLWEEPYVPDYIDSNGNLTLRIEIPGPETFLYQPTFDQVCVRFLRASEDE